MQKLINPYTTLILLGLLCTFSACEKPFESKTFIIVNGTKSEEGLTHEGDAGFWTSDANDFAAKHYYIDDDRVEDIRVTINKSWAENRLTITYLHAEVYLLAKEMEIKTVIDSAWLNDSTYTLVKAVYDENTDYSANAIFETETIYVPIVLNSGDKLELNQNYLQQVLELDYARFDDESDPDIGDYTHAVYYSPMAPVSEKYIGVKQITEGKTYLGWIKISTTETFDVKIHESYLERVE